MTDTSSQTSPFFQNTDLTLERAREIVTEGLKGADYGELYQEITVREALAKDNGEYVAISLGNQSSGFGFRVGQENRVGYSFSDIFNEQALTDAVKQSRQILRTATDSAPLQAPFGRVDEELYTDQNVVENIPLDEKIAKIDAIEAYARSLDPRISNVGVTYQSRSKDVHIITSDGQSLVDHRPLVSLNIEITLTDENGNTEVGYAILGGQTDSKDVFEESAYQAAAQKALKLASTLLIAEEAPAGVMDVVLNHGWPAVLLHEAVGHGLEGDFNRRAISVYSGKVGEKIANESVTVIDQGNLPGERGSIHFDDEGTPTQKNVLIENGILKGYMQDRQNAQLMGAAATGNGRRQSYQHLPMPRMTNTYFAPGPHDPADIIKSVKDGLFISDMGGGQIDITSGKFNMEATLAYRIRDGKICEPVKGATLVGDGLSVIQSITMVGNDLEIEKAAGACGKNGQSVIVSCGQPTVRVSNMTVGGTKKM